MASAAGPSRGGGAARSLRLVVRLGGLRPELGEGPAKSSAVTHGEKLTDADATVGLEIVSSGAVIFVVQSVTSSSSAAESLLGSFKPL